MSGSGFILYLPAQPTRCKNALAYAGAFLLVELVVDRKNKSTGFMIAKDLWQFFDWRRFKNGSAEPCAAIASVVLTQANWYQIRCLCKGAPCLEEPQQH